MKSTQLSNLTMKQLKKIKSKTFYRKLGVVRPGRRKRSTIKYIVEKSYEALPKAYKDFSQEFKNYLIENTVNTIMVSGASGEVEPYQAMFQQLKRSYKHGWEGTKRDIYTAFREQCPDVYAKYNTYVYRTGHSASTWFYDNADLKSTHGSIVTITVELPFKAKGIVYNTLTIVFNYSGQEIEANME